MYTIKHVNGLNLHHTQCLGSPLYLLLLAYVIHKNTVTLLVLLYLHIVTISSHLLTEWVNHNNNFFLYMCSDTELYHVCCYHVVIDCAVNM